MKPRSFTELYRQAERHDDYWIAGASFAFTENVVREMEHQGLTRTALAERLGATPAYVTKLLRGRVNFTLATMVRLSRALGADLHIHLGGSSSRTSRRPAVRTAAVATVAPAARAGRSIQAVAAARVPAAREARQSTARRRRRGAPSGARTR
ncbi:MAG TPA: helix-turn-helix transcriptional regulator [Thermoanaerobaculia bacterium]|nr:helix-turn-helix transcriptional regulator [Thermoanaerobaculia bacterium]